MTAVTAAYLDACFEVALAIQNYNRQNALSWQFIWRLNIRNKLFLIEYIEHNFHKLGFCFPNHIFMIHRQTFVWYLREITFSQIGLYPVFNTRLLLKWTLLGSVLVMSLAILCLFPLKIKHMVPCGEIRVICRHSNPHCAEMLNAWLFSMHLPFSSTAVSYCLDSVLSAWVMFSFPLLFDFRIKLQSEGFLGDLFWFPSSHPNQFMSTSVSVPFSLPVAETSYISHFKGYQ